MLKEVRFLLFNAVKDIHITLLLSDFSNKLLINFGFTSNKDSSITYANAYTKVSKVLCTWTEISTVSYPLHTYDVTKTTFKIITTHSIVNADYLAIGY